MKASHFAGILAILSALAACAPYMRAECDAMVQTERERCIRAHDSNDRAMEERRRERKARDPWAIPEKKGEAEDERDSRVP